MKISHIVRRSNLRYPSQEIVYDFLTFRNVNRLSNFETLRPNPLDVQHSEHIFLSYRERSCVGVHKSGRCQLPAFEWPWSSAQYSRRNPAPTSEDFIERLSKEFAVRLGFRRVNNREQDCDGLESTGSFHPPFYLRLHQGRHPAVKSPLSVPSVANQWTHSNSSFSSINQHRSTCLQRTRSTSFCSISSSSSSSTPSTPDSDSSIPICWEHTHHEHSCIVDTLAIYPSASTHLRVFVGPPIPLGAP